MVYTQKREDEELSRGLLLRVFLLSQATVEQQKGLIPAVYKNMGSYCLLYVLDIMQMTCLTRDVKLEGAKPWD